MHWCNASELNWSARELVSANLSNGNAVSYTYNADGIRTQKAYNGTTHNYVLDGSKIIKEEVSVNGNTSYELYYIYDASGSVIGFQYNNAPYYFLKNLQGDIVSIVNAMGTVVVEYTYDAWGKILSTTGTLASTIGAYNPFRYRSYYYDTETGFYYLQSRYYDPVVGRFLNADAYVYAGQGLVGFNMFAYCNNNPILGYDPCGTCFHRWDFWNDCEECGGETIEEKFDRTLAYIDEKIVEPMVDFVESHLSEYDFTYSNGMSLNGSTQAMTISLQACVSVDTEGNIGLQGSGGGGVSSGTPGVNVMYYETTTNAPDINKLNGPAYQVGGSFGVPIPDTPISVIASGDINVIPDNSNDTYYYGHTIGKGIGFADYGPEAHVGVTGTSTFVQFNIFDVLRNTCDTIIRW